MSDLFSGLEQFGLGKLSKIDVFEDEKGQKEEGDAAPAPAKTFLEADVLFDKTYNCPVCDNEFKARTVRTGKVKLLSADSDLRPKYQDVDSLKYDAVVCPKCGFSALTKYFAGLTSVQSKSIKENISINFKGITEPEVYSYEDAIARHKLALLSTIVKKGKMSERAYTCLKLAWLNRGKAETLPKDTPDYDAQIKLLQQQEDELLGNAYEGFISAFSKENFPMCGMDEHTTTYLAADLARRIGKKEEAGRWVSKILVARDSNDRIKNKARELKELLQKD